MKLVMSRKRKREKDKRLPRGVFVYRIHTDNTKTMLFFSPFTLLSASLLSVSRLSLSLPVRLRTCGNPTSSGFWGSFVAIECLFAALNCAGNVSVIF